VAGSCEHGSETFGSIKGKEFAYQLSDYHILNRCSMESVIYQPEAVFAHYRSTFSLSTSLKNAESFRL
jgi:hypothetical protein